MRTNKRASVARAVVDRARVYQERVRAMFTSDPSVPPEYADLLQMTPAEEAREALAKASERWTIEPPAAQQLLMVHSGDPSGLIEGQMWIRTNGTDRELCMYVGGQIRRSRLC